MTTVQFNLKTGDLFFDGPAIWNVLDTFPNNVRAKSIDGLTRCFHYDEIRGCLILECPKDYEALDLRDISQETAAWLAQNSGLNGHVLQKVYDRVVQGWPCTSAYEYLGLNPGTPKHIRQIISKMGEDCAFQVAQNHALDKQESETLARHPNASVRRALARNVSVLNRNPAVVQRLKEDADEAVLRAVEQTMRDAFVARHLHSHNHPSD